MACRRLQGARNFFWSLTAKLDMVEEIMSGPESGDGKKLRWWLILVGLSVLLPEASACCAGPPRPEVERVLKTAWQSYCQHYISPEGQVIIPERGGGTISEAQAYALLRAVWAGDEATFGRVYAWTRRNLARVGKFGDYLLAWQWGRKDDSSWGVVDWNTASDGDLDYALALQLASRRGWRAPAALPPYREETSRVLNDILDKEVVSLPTGTLLLTPGNWHLTVPPFLLNPSYFSPGFYPLFNLIKPDPRWERLRADTYLLLANIVQGLRRNPSVALFPDWCQVDAGAQPAPAAGRGAHFGWEAVRLPFRLALDALWHGEQRAIKLLANTIVPFAQKEWQTRGRLAAVYDDDGQPLASFESPVIYAGVLAAFLAVGDQPGADRMAQKLLSFYQEQGRQAYFVSPENYYDNNWAWLGLALYAGWVRVF